jgi:hypothetical protein
MGSDAMSGRGKASGYTLGKADAPTIFGMVAREDRDHDIAAWFGVNQGRIAEVKDGSKFGIVAAAPSSALPPKGPPGIKGRRLRTAVERAIAQLQADDPNSAAIPILIKARAKYDEHET